MTAWKEILISLGGNATTLIVLAFLARSLIQTWLAKDVKKFEAGLTTVANSELERLKSELRAGADASLERLRVELQLKGMERQVRFSKLHERRAEAIEELYTRLVDTQFEARRYVLVTGHDESARAKTGSAIYDKLANLNFLIERNRIYLPENICGLLDAFQKELRRAVVAVQVYAPITYPASQSIAEEKAREILKAVEAFEANIPRARKSLEEELRAILGGEN